MHSVSSRTHKELRRSAFARAAAARLVYVVRGWLLNINSAAWGFNVEANSEEDRRERRGLAWKQPVAAAANETDFSGREKGTSEKYCIVYLF